MKAHVNLNHPRMAKDGEPCEMPLCIRTGFLDGGYGFGNDELRELTGLDQFGIAVSIYFKLLKAYACFFLLCTILVLPLFFVYHTGSMST